LSLADTSRAGAPGDLPHALVGWGSAFAALDPAVAIALAPLLHRLDELVARHADVEGPVGEPEGLAGLTTRGVPERMLVSEWLLAEEAPDEFLRRAAARELLHLDTAFRHDPPAGATRVVVDTGPSQAGAARLVQLAALVVLHRRAHARGSTLEIGVLGEHADAWHTGGLPELLRTWLSARRSQDGDLAQVEARLPTAHRGWFLLDPSLAARLTPGSVPGRRVLTAKESGWAASGAVAVEVRLAGETVHLPLPPGDVAVRTLRGNGFRQDRRTAPAPDTSAVVLHRARFAGTSPRLVGRGDEPGQVLTARPGPPDPRRRPHLRTFRGTALAAGVTGGRLVVMSQHEEGVEVSVVGKRLGRWDAVRFPTSALGLPADELAQVARGPLLPAHHAGGVLWLRLPSGWFELGVDGTVVPHPETELVTPVGPDELTHAVRPPSAPTRLWTPSGTIDDVPAGARVVGSGRWVAVELEPGRWTVGSAARGPARLDLRTPPADDVVGLVVLSGAPHLAVLSASGVVLRLVGAAGSRTLTKLSGVRQKVALHPTLPLLARDLGDGVVEVSHLGTGARQGTVPGSLA
jgi:hypothetical protein